MSTNLASLLIGLSLLTIGGEALIRGALAAGRRLGLSPMVAGLVIVGFGTSAPELVVSIDAALRQQPDIAVGNVIGSNIGNILLILGCCALIAPLSISKRALAHDATMMIGATVAFILLARGAGLSRLDGTLLLGLLAAYLAWTYWKELKGNAAAAGAMHRAEADEFQTVPTTLWLTLASLAGGLAALILGSRLTLHGALGLGELLAVPDAVIGLTVVAVGTSLPEFAVSVLATVRGHHEVAIGNILGSNIFNILGILGVSALMQPLPVSGRMLWVDQWVMLGAAVLLVVLLLSGRRLNRYEGGFLLGCYLTYLIVMYSVFTNGGAS